MKKIIYFLLIVVFILLGVLCYKKFIVKDENKPDIVKVLKGDKIEENVYGIKLNDTGKGYVNSGIIDENNIYYSLGEDVDNTEFYKYDLYTGEKKKFIEKFEYYDCKKYGELIGCADNEKTDFYDKDGTLKFTINGLGIVYNNGNYYSISDNKIVDKDNKEYFILDKKYFGYDLTDYFVVNDNIYLIYFKFDDDKNRLKSDWAFVDCPNLTIHAPAGSYAEQYAKENHIPFVAEE